MTIVMSIAPMPVSGLPAEGYVSPDLEVGFHSGPGTDDGLHFHFLLCVAQPRKAMFAPTLRLVFTRIQLRMTVFMFLAPITVRGALRGKVCRVVDQPRKLTFEPARTCVFT
jgi:hypothetical protein